MLSETDIMPKPHHAPIAVHRALRKLGTDILNARRRRRLPASVVAERAFTTRQTLQKVEQGDPGVSMGIYASTLNALGLLDGLAQAADITRDPTGLAMATDELPQRVRLKRQPRL